MKKLISNLVKNVFKEDYVSAEKSFKEVISEKVYNTIQEMKVDVASGLISEAPLKRRAASGKSLSQRKKEAQRRRRGLSPSTGKRVDVKRSRKAKVSAKRSKVSRKRGQLKRKRTNRRFK